MLFLNSYRQATFEDLIIVLLRRVHEVIHCHTLIALEMGQSSAGPAVWKTHVYELTDEIRIKIVLFNLRNRLGHCLEGTPQGLDALPDLVTLWLL